MDINPDAVMSHEHHGVLNHKQLKCLLFVDGMTTKKSSNSALLDFYERNQTVTGRFHSKRVGNVKNVSSMRSSCKISWTAIKFQRGFAEPGYGLSNDKHRNGSLLQFVFMEFHNNVF